MEFVKYLVSVIIPVYNAERFIADTIESVLSQTYTKFEIILIEDCSKDNSLKIIQKYSERDNRIKCIYQNVNKGAAEARNRGLEESKGQYIAFLDSDDLWVCTKLEKQIAQLSSGNIAFGFTAYDIIDEYHKTIKGKIKIKKQIEYGDLLTKTMISTPTVIIDRNMIGELRMPLRRTGQDYAFWLMLLRKQNAFGIDESLVHVRKRPNSLSKNKLQNIKDVWEVQAINEKIPEHKVFINIIRYSFYTLKKRFL